MMTSPPRYQAGNKRVDDMTYDELLGEVPSHLRQQVAQARNAAIRTKEAREEMARHGLVLETTLKKLNQSLNVSQLARLVGLSRRRVVELVQRDRRRS